ncbi:MAG TPA: hypothetical protein VM123_01075 [archaeon]|nr:hypothetical protein [archaeon]
MVRPLDHVTVIQQINFAERVHQNQQMHPELSRLQAEAIEREKKIAENKKTQALHKPEKTKIHLRDEGARYRGREKKRKIRKGKRRGIDLSA